MYEISCTFRLNRGCHKSQANSVLFFRKVRDVLFVFLDLTSLRYECEMRPPRRTTTILRWLVTWVSVECRHSWATALSTASPRQQYSIARTSRALHGHDAALPYYQDLLRKNPDDAAAATHIASNQDAISIHQRLGDPSTYTTEECQSFSSQLQRCNFTALDIAEHIFPNNSQPKAKLSSAPLYLQPLRAGQKPPSPPDSAIATCIQLFILSVCIPLSICQRYLGQDMMALAEKLGIFFVNAETQLVVPYCHIMPVTCGIKTLYLVTDLHPNVLSTTSIDQENEAVMYIGPDSLALVDHWASALVQNDSINEMHQIVDFCTGSGIQAIAVATQVSPYSKVTCVDLNPRALRIASLNFALNGLLSPTLVLGDLQDEGAGISLNSRPWQETIRLSTMILANPPFLPVPVEDISISKRHGLFSSGGAGGEDILQRVVQLAAENLAPGGSLAIVSEFMNPHSTFEKRLQQWWGTRPAKGVFFVNEQAMDTETYSMKRADSQIEFNTWSCHLKNQDITHVSPGLLFVRASSECTGLSVERVMIPKTEHGSIWTSSNVLSRKITRPKVDEIQSLKGK